MQPVALPSVAYVSKRLRGSKYLLSIPNFFVAICFVFFCLEFIQLRKVLNIFEFKGMKQETFEK